MSRELPPGPRLVRDLTPPLTREEIEHAARFAIEQTRSKAVIGPDYRDELMDRHGFTAVEIEALFHVEWPA